METIDSGTNAHQVQQAIENLYTVFKSYQLRPHVAGCSHCVSEMDQQQIHQRPLRELTADDLSRFAHKAMTTWGTVEDFKHFLPRLLECLPACERYGPIDAEILLSKLNYGQWNTWPDEEQVAIKQYMAAQWRTVLHLSTEDIAAEVWLCAIGQAEDDLTGYLKIWAGCDAPAASAHLAELIIDDGNDVLAKGSLRNAFWHERQAQMKQVITWLASDSVHRRLEKSFFAQPPQALAEQLSLALTIQEALAFRFDSPRSS